jgi:hypothetical protein
MMVLSRMNEKRCLAALPGAPRLDVARVLA